MIDILHNGEKKDVHASLLEAALLELGYDADMVIATAVNGVFCPQHLRAIQILKSGDTLDVVAPMQGG